MVEGNSDDSPARPLVRFEAVSKRFGSIAAVERLSLDIFEREFFALLGPSGCGKTTLLRMLAGFEQPSEGCILLDGTDISSVPPHRRPINMMFQSYALFPHLTVEANIAFGLKQDGMPKPEIANRVRDMLTLVRLDGFGARKPHQLSGGQRQRVALARALAIEPRMLLLDEPFGALDAKVRKELRKWLRSLHEEIHVTSIFVTHDQEEALEVANRVVVMDKGRIEQIGTPGDVYDDPATAFVHGFIGESVVLPVDISDGRVRLGDQVLDLESHNARSGPSKLFIRRHDMSIGPAGSGALQGAVKRVRAFGPTQRADILLNAPGEDTLIEIDAPRDGILKAGDIVGLQPRRYRIFAA